MIIRGAVPEVQLLPWRMHLRFCSPCVIAVVVVATSALILPIAARAANELAPMTDQDTITVRADKAWEERDALHFQGHFELRAGDWFVAADTASLFGPIEDPERVVAEGTPVRFWLSKAGDRARVEGEGRQLEYLREANVVRLSGNAVIRDRRNIMRSSVLEYDTDAELLIASGTEGVEIVMRDEDDARP